MRLVVAGGRDYQLTHSDFHWLQVFCYRNQVSEIVSGGASGVDRGAEQCADRWNLKLTVFPADWSTHGRAAGPIRNRKMAEYCDLVVLFPGGRGTRSMEREALRANKVVQFAPVLSKPR